MGPPRRLDGAQIAWAFYAVTRLLDVITTSAAIERFGRNQNLEANLIPRLFMSYYGVHLGNILHEVAVLGGAIIIYMFLAEARRSLPIFRLATPRLVPYTIGATSALLVASNLRIFLR